MEKLINKIIEKDLFDMDEKEVKKYLKDNNITNDDIIEVMDAVDKSHKRYFDSVENDVVELVLHGIIEMFIY